MSKTYQKMMALLVAAVAGALLMVLVLWSMGMLTHSETEAEGQAHEHTVEDHDVEGRNHGEHEHEGQESHGVLLSEQQLKESGIQTEVATTASFAQSESVPGQLMLNADKEAKVLAGISGVARSVTGRVGDVVKAGSVLATLDSREFSEASANLLAAKGRYALAEEKLKREKLLWDKRISAEQDFLEAKQVFNEAKIERDRAGQQLITLGVSPNTVKNWQASDGLSYALRAPLAGTVLSRDMTLGEVVSPEKMVFRVADLSSLWVELVVPVAKLSAVRVGQAVTVRATGQGEHSSVGHVVYIQPELDMASRSALVRLSVENKKGEWRVGEYIQAEIAGDSSADVVSVPLSAVLMDGDTATIFVKEGKYFEPRVVKTGNKSQSRIVIREGLKADERYAVGNIFILKAEMGKAEAAHEH